MAVKSKANALPHETNELPSHMLKARRTMNVSELQMAKDKANVLPQERNELIFQMLKTRRSMKVSELQEILGVSDMTVRRCLNEMASDGLIQRVHGGAIAIDAEDNSRSFLLHRIKMNSDIKMAIAREVIRSVPEEGSIFLDSGTTCFAVARELVHSGKKCMVVTDSIRILQEFQPSRTINCMILGGGLSDDLTTVEGPLAIETAGKIRVELCIFSADGFDDEQLENHFLNGALTKKIMIQRAEQSMFVADSSKCNKKRYFSFCGWDEVDFFVTDSGLPEAVRDSVARKGVDVRIVPLNTE